ncbi:MAG TPA: class C beta-lactamase [Herbaspirillum sp.]|jgi:CubicO group peptidase (beta-lactamase class C family)
MRKKTIELLKRLLISTCALAAASSHAADNADNADQCKIGAKVDDTIRPLMAKYGIPGMAVAISIDGKHCFYNYGVASKKTRQRVTGSTLFEIGSISKTFTATLASYAQADGKLSLSDSASRYLPFLKGSSFDRISLLNLGTHTSGGLPLQVPDNIHDTDQLMRYFKQWQPDYAAGTHRIYSNPGIGMLGMIAAKSMAASFSDAIEKNIFHPLGMTHSYINVPADQIRNYAQGYTKTGTPIRVQDAVLAPEAYGVKSGTADMIRFIEANMQAAGLDGKLQHAITDTHTGYFTAGPMTQDLIWEQYPYPVALEQLLAGNADMMAYQAVPATRLGPPLAPRTNVLINKTGSTNGFAAYVAFIPAKKTGIVILANKNYPIAPRVTAAYQILTQLDRQAVSAN